MEAKTNLPPATVSLLDALVEKQQAKCDALTQLHKTQRELSTAQEDLLSHLNGTAEEHESSQSFFTDCGVFYKGRVFSIDEEGDLINVEGPIVAMVRENK